jgi:hypothetical protein
VNDFILSSLESDKVLHSKMYTKSSQLKNEIINPIKEIFAVISKKFKSLVDACKKEEKDLQISCSAAETAYSLYMLQFAEQEKAFNKGKINEGDLWAREFNFIKAVI